MTDPVQADPVLTALGLPPAEVVGLVETLRARGETVATAESLTAGLVCAALTCVPVVRIFERAGKKPWWGLLLGVPFAGFTLCMAALAFMKWKEA